MAGHVTRIVVAGTLILGFGIQAIADDSGRRGRCAAAVPMPEHIRSTNCDLVRAIGIGMSDSPSFRRLVDRIAALHGIVYFAARQVVQTETRRVIDGTLQHRVSVAGSHRILFATVTPYSGGRAVPIIAHELQHVIEVLESNAASEREIDELFERIGVRTAARTMETAAARDVEIAVSRELATGKS